LSRIECPHCGNQIAIQVIKPEPKVETKTETTVTINDISLALNEWADCIDIVEQDNAIVITPKGYLGKDVWAEINNSLKPFNAEWISAKKESRWMIKS